MITNPEDFFVKGCGRCPRFATADCSTRRWTPGLAALRVLCRAAGLTETAKWGHPCYMHAGRNIVLIGAFRDDFRLTFFHAALMRDPEGLLERQGPNSRTPDAIRLTANDQVTLRAPAIAAYLREAMGYADAGLKPPKTDSAPDLPEEVIEALDADPDLAEAFAALTPGRQRSYAIVIGAAKRPETRAARVEALRPKILAGKGANER